MEQKLNTELQKKVFALKLKTKIPKLNTLRYDASSKHCKWRKNYLFENK